MSRQFISICGNSGVGKKTLIRALLAAEPQDLRDRFGVEGTVAAHGFSREFHPLGLVFEATEDCILHFWQYDHHHWIECLRRAFSVARHRVILLWRPWAEHSATIVARGGAWRPSPSVLEGAWHELYVPRFRGIEATGVEFELVNASTQLYDRMPWPLYPR
jgi:hypothetical protein